MLIINIILSSVLYDICTSLDWIVRSSYLMIRGNRTPFQSFYLFGNSKCSEIMKEIELTQGKVALVDDEDYDYLNQWNWFADKHGSIYYVTRNQKINGKSIKIYMHRFIMNTPINLECDHRDHNCLNNQKSNLRNCLPKQNKMNGLPRGKSKYLGVAYNGKYIRAQISVNEIRIHIGNFKTEKDAARAYDTKAKELFGEFANLNFKVA